MFHIAWLQVNFVISAFHIPWAGLEYLFVFNSSTYSNNFNAVEPPEDIFGKIQDIMLSKWANLFKG